MEISGNSMDCEALKGSLRRAVSFLKGRLKKKPALALFLGTGLGSLSSRIRNKMVVPYGEIPSFPRPTAFSQENAVVMGDIGKKTVISFEGRFHAYEGHSFQEIGFPVRVAHALGAKVLISTNIAGGINLSFKCGDWVLIEDHLNFMGMNPLVGPHEPWMGDRFVDLAEPYDGGLLERAEEVLRKMKLPFKRGVYAAVLGPHLETRAEYRFLKTAGADLVGMSSVPEVLVARQLKMKVFALSVVTDECDPDNLKPINVPAVLKIAKKASKPLSQFLVGFVRSLGA